MDLGSRYENIEKHWTANALSLACPSRRPGTRCWNGINRSSLVFDDLENRSYLLLIDMFLPCFSRAPAEIPPLDALNEWGPDLFALIVVFSSGVTR
jgi:hypothetical protein